MKFQNPLSTIIVFILLFFQIVLSTLPAKAIPEKVSEPISQGDTNIGDKISAHWNCLRTGNTAVEAEFKLSKDGYIYNLHFTKGLEDPFAIRSAIHAIVFAMPYEHSNSASGITAVKCTINGDKNKPNIKTTLLQAPEDLTSNDLSKIKVADEYVHQLFISGPMAQRLQEVCLHLFDHPDSNAAYNEVKKIGSYIGLDTSVAHDWVGISRWGNHSIVIMRHPSAQATKYVRASIAALLQANKISSNKINRYALEEAWVKHAALEALAISKAEPLLLASASVLTNQFKMAKEQYRLAIRERNPKAASMLSQMNQFNTDKELKPPSLNSRFKPTRNASDWKALLRWIPVDVELMISSRINTQKKKEENAFPLFGGLVLPDSPDALNNHSFSRKKHLLENNRLFTGVTEISSVHAARNFKTPNGSFLGLGVSDNVEIMVLPESHKQIASKAMNLFRNKSDRRDVIEGFEILGFEEFPWTFGFTDLGKKHFLANPIDGVLIAATDPEILREVLMRLRNQPDNRALPGSIPEWKWVDTSAPSWAVRHYDQAYVPFDSSGMYDIVTAKYIRTTVPKDGKGAIPKEIGLTFSAKGSKITLHHLSNSPDTLKALKKTYEHVFNYSPQMHPLMKVKEPKNLETANIEGRVLTVEGKVDKFSMVGIEVILSFGYFVAI